MSWELTRLQVAALIENFIEGRCGEWDWDDFTQGMKFSDAHLQAVQSRCTSLPDEFPSANLKQYCNDEGLQVLREIADELTANS